MAKSAWHSRDELRELILATGQSMLEEEGLSSGAAALTFKRVFARVEEDTGIRLTNASVIRRVWDSQSEFQPMCWPRSPEAKVIKRSSGRINCWAHRGIVRSDNPGIPRRAYEFFAVSQEISIPRR